MRDAGWTYSEGTFTTDGGTTDVVNNANRTLDPGAGFSARYFVQRDYIDNVGEYGGSMVAAIGAAQGTAETAFMRALQGGDLTPDIAAQYEAASAMGAFAQRYDATLYGERYGSFGVPGLLNAGAAAAYDGSSVSAALQEVAQDRSRTDDHPMYQHILDGTFAPLFGEDGSVGPTVGADRASGRRDGDETYITARSRYNSGEPHGWFRGGSPAISVDLGTQLLPLETVLFTESTVLAQGEPFGWQGNSGGFAQVDAGPLDLRYAHLAQSWQQQRSQELNQAAMEANLFRYSLPAGYSLGPLFDGPLPASDATHLHLEFVFR